MAQIFDAYRLRSLGGRNASIAEALRTTGHARAVPTGTGDCAAPRLIAEAGRLGLTEVSLSEVWWAPGEGRHGRAVGPCAERCQPLMGFLLCPAPAP
jgi:tRNA pseudouridine32 synthase/23S rRNA pseudouridine746 synthase